jgi:hypothetical protein
MGGGFNVKNLADFGHMKGGRRISEIRLPADRRRTDPTRRKGGKTMGKGDLVKTPRFLKVRLEEVFSSEQDALRAGYVEPTHYSDCQGYQVYGKHIGTNLMKFAAVTGLEHPQDPELKEAWEAFDRADKRT